MKLINERNGQSLEYGMFGEGNIMRENARVLLNCISNNPQEKTNLTDLANRTGLPRISVAWLIKDACVRENKSIIAQVAKKHSFNVDINEKWNNRKHAKPIIRAKKVSKLYHGANLRLRDESK